MSKAEFSGSGETGVSIEYDRRHGLVRIGGWFDGGYEIWTGADCEGGIPLAEFLDHLGITDADIRRARKEASDE